MWHNRAGEVKWQCRYPIYLSRAGAGESTFPLQQWRREEWPHKKGFVSLVAGELSGGYFQEQLEDDYSIPRVCAKPEDKETFIFPRGCHSLFRVCVMGFSQGCVTLSATHRKWISHLKLLAISQLNHRHIPFTEKLWKPQTSQIMEGLRSWLLARRGRVWISASQDLENATSKVKHKAGTREVLEAKGAHSWELLQLQPVPWSSAPTLPVIPPKQRNTSQGYFL